MTLEEIKSAINENPELRKEVVNVSIETDEGKEVLNNYAKNHFDENVGTHISNTYNKIDEDLAKILGHHKDKTMKTYEWVNDIARKYTSLRDSQGEVSKEEFERFKVENSDLLKQLEKAKEGGFYKGEFENLQTSFSAEKTSWEKEKSEYENKMRNFAIDTDLNKGIAGVKWSPVYPETTRKELLEVRLKALKENSKIGEDGKIVYFDGNGNMIKNPDHSPMQGQDVVKFITKDLQEVEKPKGGHSEKGGQAQFEKGSSDNKATINLPNGHIGLSTQDQVIGALQKALIGEGVARGSKDYNDAIDGYFESNPELSDLPTH